MRRDIASIVAASAMACGLARTGAAWAADTEDALIHHGIELRKQGNDPAALQEMQRAYAIRHAPRAAAQLGFAEQALGLWPDAEEHVHEALTAANDPWVRKNRTTIEAALATIRGHVVRIQIDGGEPGAQVSVNGRVVGSLPLRDSVPVNTGPIDVDVRAAGFAPALKTVNVAAGELMRVSFTLLPAAEASAQPRQPPPFRPGLTPAPVINPLAAPGSSNPTLVAVRDPGRGKRMTAIGLVAGGVVAIGGGVAASVVAKNKFDAIGSDAAAGRPYNESNGNWKGYETGAGVLYVVGGAAVVGGIVLYVAGRPRIEAARPPAVSSVALRPTIVPGRAGATVSVRF